MTISNLITFLDEFIATVVNSQEFSRVNILTEQILAGRRSVEAQLVSEGNYNITGAQYTKSVRNSINNALAPFSPSKAGQRLAHAKTLLHPGLSESTSTVLTEYIETIERFLEQIEAHKFSNANNIQDLYTTCQDIDRTRSNILNYTNGLKESIQALNDFHVDPSEDSVIFSFEPVHESLQLHAETCQAILIVYECLCQILNVSIQEYPLKLRSHYSGSDHISVSGYAAAVQILGELFLNAGRYFSENFTHSGQFQVLSRQFEETDKQLGLTEKLIARGHNVEATLDVLKKNLHFIAQALNENLKFQYKLSVNLDTIQIYPESVKALPYNPKQLTGSVFDEKA